MCIRLYSKHLCWYRSSTSCSKKFDYDIYSLGVNNLTLKSACVVRCLCLCVYACFVCVGVCVGVCMYVFFVCVCASLQDGEGRGGEKRLFGLSRIRYVF